MPTRWIVFRDGPAGRRPGVVGGPDVWEIIQIFLAEGEDAQAAAANLGLRRGLVDAAAAYYASYTDPVDSWIETNRALMTEGSDASERKSRRRKAG